MKYFNYFINFKPNILIPLMAFSFIFILISCNSTNKEPNLKINKDEKSNVYTFINGLTGTPYLSKEGKDMNYKDSIYFDKAFAAAFSGVEHKLGAPFGAVVILNDSIVGIGCNRTIIDKDPSAHGEIVAIRNACKNLNTINLKEATLYSTAVPCPMCATAIYWSNIKNVYYVSNAQDLKKINIFYNKLFEAFKFPSNQLIMQQANSNEKIADSLFSTWNKLISKNPKQFEILKFK